LPSLAEGMSNAVLESMSCAIPVISTDVGDIKEFIKDNYNGLIINKKDPEDIAKKVEYLLNSKKSDIFGKRARETIIKKGLSWEKSAADYIKIYNKVI